MELGTWCKAVACMKSRMLLQVMKIVHAIRMGWIKPSAKKDAEKPNYYLLWNETSDADKDKKHRVHIPAPKMKLPG